ncbi:MAG: PEP-CTERM sorting domain-containing protein [Phycisphaerae bacterium]|nr:PEP-CTERM sorting domain-containing protein [Phycisphaerae bacterium]
MRHQRLAIVVMLAACGSALAQVDPPPTWGQNDGVSLSVGYAFPTDAFPPTPDFSVSWSGWGGDQWEKSDTIAYMPTLSTHVGAWGLTENNTSKNITGVLSVRLANGILLPEKGVWYQFDVFWGNDSNYWMTPTTERGFQIENEWIDAPWDLGWGWWRITGTFTIKPQPPWEQFDFNFVTAPGGGPVAIDNFYVHTHCVPTPTTVALFSLAALGIARRRR